MFNTQALTKEQQNARNREEWEVWENNVTAIFSGFLGVFIILTVVESAVGLWLAQFVRI